VTRKMSESRDAAGARTDGRLPPLFPADFQKDKLLVGRSAMPPRSIRVLHVGRRFDCKQKVVEHHLKQIGDLSVALLAPAARGRGRLPNSAASPGGCFVLSITNSSPRATAELPGGRCGRHWMPWVPNCGRLSGQGAKRPRLPPNCCKAAAGRITSSKARLKCSAGLGEKVFALALVRARDRLAVGAPNRVWDRDDPLVYFRTSLFHLGKAYLKNPPRRGPFLGPPCPLCEAAAPGKKTRRRGNCTDPSGWSCRTAAERPKVIETVTRQLMRRCCWKCKARLAKQPEN